MRASSVAQVRILPLAQADVKCRSRFFPGRNFLAQRDLGDPVLIIWLFVVTAG
jgi:hypothetical protein